MKVISISKPGGPEVLELSERPVPEPGPGEVRIRIHAAGINRPDIFQREGKYPAPEGVPEDIPGLEVAGVIDSTGKNVVNWHKGDNVCALLAGGGYAEYVVVPQQQCLPIPGSLSYTEAASLPETFFTVWTNIFDRAEFSRGDHVLIHGGTSGIGVAGIQMVRAMGGQVYVTAGTAEKCSFCESLGAFAAINYKEQDFGEELANRNLKMNIILDMIGGDYTSKNLKLLSVEGCLVMINAMEGRMAQVDLTRIMVKRLTLTGSTLRGRSASFKGQIAKQLLENIWPAIEKGTIRPVVYREFSLENASEAHRLMESGSHIGKIVLRCSE